MKPRQTDQPALAAQSTEPACDRCFASSFAAPFLLQVINGLCDPVFVKDREHRWILINDALCKLLGRDRSELIGKSDYDFLPSAQADVFWEKDELVFTTGLANENEEYISNAAGETLCIATKKSIIYDQTGTAFLVAIVRDITPYKQIEMDLQAAQHRFQLVIDNIPQTIWWKDCNSVYQGCNRLAAKAAGLSSPQAIVGKTDHDLPWATEQAEFYRDRDQQVIQTGQPKLHIIETQQQADGRQAWLDTNKVPLRDPMGEIVGVLVMIEDITDRKRIEAALQHSEALFRTLTTNIPIAVYRTLWDCDWTIEYISDFFEELTGYPASDFIHHRDRTWASVTHPDDLSHREQAVKTAIAACQPFEVEYRLLHRDGSIRWVYEKGQGKFDLSGSPLYLTGAVLDISDRKLAEAALQQFNEELEQRVLDRTAQLEQEIQERKRTEIELRESQQRLALLIEQTPLAVIEWNTHLELTDWNSAAEKIFGFSHSEALGQHPGFVLDSSQQQAVEQSLVQVVLNQQLPMKSIETNFTKSGDQIICEWHDYPLIDANGNLIGLASLAQDITDRKRTEEALKRQLAAIEASLNGIALCDAEGRYTYMNQAHAAIYGYDHSKELIGQHWSIFYDGLEQQRFEQEIMPLLAQTGHWHGESIARRRDGSMFLEETSLAVAPDGGLVCVVQDITDRKLAEAALKQSENQLRQRAEQLEFALQELQQTQAQLIQSEKMSSLGQLVAGVAHAINNPVNFIAGNLTHANNYMQDLIHLLQLYQQHYPNPAIAVQAEADAIDLDFLLADLPKLLKSMHFGVDRIQKIVRSLRNFSRMDEAEKKAVDLHDGIDSTLVILQNRLKAMPNRGEIEVIKQYSSLPKIECYASQMNQVFMNLLSNAIDAIEERLVHSLNPPPRILITTAITKTQVKIQISDNGAGVPAEALPRLFDPFFTTKPIGKGTGMGLSISYQIITEKHGGSLVCRSTGEETEFSIAIPICYSES